jgi:hypothetical protein
LADVLPLTLAGGWKRGDVSALSDVPPVVSQLRPEEAAQARYTGPGAVTLRAFRMPAETSAFELIQKWRQSDGLAAYKGAYFFIATGEGAADVLRELQKISPQ